MQSVIVGVGGQGIVFASKVLGHIALTRGEQVMGSEVHGMSQRGGSVISHFKIGAYKSPLVRKGCADVLLAFDQMEALRSYDFLADGAHAIVNVHDRAALENKDLQAYFASRNIRVHAISGYEILKEVMSPWPLADIVLQHHERLDGSGYPRGLKGEEMRLEARILAVADVVESMTSYRPYRLSLGLDAAVKEIETNKGVLYDASVVDACVRLFREKGYRLPAE